MMKTNTISMVLVFFLAVTAMGCKNQQVQEVQPMKVKVMKVAATNEGGVRQFSGTVEESSGSELSFSSIGMVSTVRVEAGQRVRKGDLIAELDESTLRNSYLAAASMLEQAEDAYRRMKQLHDSGSLPEIQWVEVQSKLKQAQSAEAIAKKNLTDSRLYAPFSGVIASKSIEVGQNVMPGMPVVKLVTIGTVKVKVEVPENEVADIAIGQSADVEVMAIGGKTFVGKVTEKGIVANSLSRTYEVKATVNNPHGELMPGMICNLAFSTSNDSMSIVLPCPVVALDSNNRPFVWVNDSGKAQKREVITGSLTRDGVTITSGLAVGDEVIVEGQQKVSSGMDITIEK
ncbi:MAG: efflux RND transporter periplasmic adaptor subunit [Muribaculaceae bacterium]